ncbi:MAG: hybrid sensor histidine kinase/response regulator [Verrucomicrobia bacterium]|nr:hybrid sensor histidine kinase/response regulator [Verrucomicrobiota bacterium]
MATLEAVAMNTAPAVPPTAAKARILVVDDITKNLQVVGTMLRNAGYEVMPTTSGAQALERVRAQAPDLVLLDLMMPEMDGLEVCRRLKADPATQQLPIIFLTASNEMEHLVKGFEVGAVDYVTKPFNPPELLARVRTHIELKQARQRLREMNDEKNEFMGIVAHDLRSPLTAIQGFAEMMQEDAEMDRAETQEFAGRIRETAKRMTEMVQNLLDANRIERGEMKVNLAPTDLSALLSSVVAAYRPRATAKQQRIHFEDAAGPVTVSVDPSITVQVLENLVSNAVKYSPAGKNIFVRLTRLSQVARCEVQDEGPGLSADDQKKLFGKFARLSAKPTGGEHATGLGLSIVKKMVEAMNGRVWCESELGKGATFVVEFPAA